jgi:hypothetical protein
LTTSPNQPIQHPIHIRRTDGSHPSAAAQGLAHALGEQADAQPELSHQQIRAERGAESVVEVGEVILALVRGTWSTFSTSSTSGVQVS